MDARTIHPVAEKYVVDHPGEGCPTVRMLVDAHELSSLSRLADPWESGYRVECSGDEEVWITSAGPDRRFGTNDDITIPER